MTDLESDGEANVWVVGNALQPKRSQAVVCESHEIRKKYLERRWADLATALDQPSNVLLVHVGGGVMHIRIAKRCEYTGSNSSPIFPRWWHISPSLLHVTHVLHEYANSFHNFQKNFHLPW
jgi:hypothetical protein